MNHLIFSSLFLATTSFAASEVLPISTPSLVRTVSYAGATIQDEQTVTCDISGSQAAISRAGPLVNLPSTYLKPLRFTKSIRNEAVLLNLIEMAAAEVMPQVEACTLYPGACPEQKGPAVSYTGTNSSNKFFIMKATHYPVPLTSIRKKLVQFLDVNCGKIAE